MARFEVEIMRSNVTVGQFLSYVRAQLKKRGLDDFTGSLDYDNFVGGNGWDAKVNHKEQNDSAYAELGIEYEEVRDLPYNKKSYQRKANGVASNEIVEFEFDNEKTGRGYYYLVDGEDEAESVESTTDEAAAAESETEAENESVESVESVASVESVDNGENNSCGERAATNQTTKGADNLGNRETAAETAEPEPEQEDSTVLAEEAVDEPIAGTTYAGEPVTLEAIAHEFARQPKYYDERARRDTTDSIIEYHFQWCDSDGYERRDWIGIPMSNACSAAGVVFDYIEDDEDLDARTLAEYVEQEYELDADGDPADVRAYEEIRRDIWQSALDECDRARDELCSHEDISEPWFRELVEEMYARVKASVEEYEI